MKNLTLLNHACLVVFLSGIMLFISIACNESSLEELTIADPIEKISPLQVDDFLNYVDFGSEVIIVQNGNSVQKAVEAANPGDVIFVEPGEYREALTIDKPGIKLIGTGTTPEESVLLENLKLGEKCIGISQEEQKVELVNINTSNLIEKYSNSPNLRRGKFRPCRMLVEKTREDLGGGIAHYEYVLQLGSGEFDVVRLHRVVRERHPYHPIRTKGDVFMVHGAGNTFNAIFLTAGAEIINAETSSPYFLASNNIDVWGIDLAWTLVPMETTDFSFMKDWGIERDADHTLAAMSIARLVRGFTGQGFNRMNLLGFSYGVHVVYGAAGKETQMHSICRDVKGLIPVDYHFKYAPEHEELRIDDCLVVPLIQADIDGGQYQYSRAGTIMMGDLALSNPNDPSPIPPFSNMGFTNSQALMFIVTNPAAPPVSYWHFFAGNPDEFYYSDPLRFFRMAVTIPPYMPLQSVYDHIACACDEVDIGHDDHLAEISVPILYIGAAGGTGTVGDYSSSLTASVDITNYNVSIPGADPASDYGHADLWFGYEANELVWSVLRDWLLNHTAHSLLP